MRKVQQGRRGDPSKAERPDVGQRFARQLLQAFVEENANYDGVYSASKGKSQPLDLVRVRSELRLPSNSPHVQMIIFMVASPPSSEILRHLQ